MLKFKNSLIKILILPLIIACSTTNKETTQTESSLSFGVRSVSSENQGASFIQSLPLVERYVISDRDAKKYGINREVKSNIEHYLGFLGLKNIISSKPNRETFLRLMSSSTQFLICPDIEDWDCLERTPELKPNKEFRTDTDRNLGSKIKIDSNLHLKSFFANQWDVDKQNKEKEKLLSSQLQGIVNEEKWDRISLAVYGIDDISQSMKSIFDSLIEAKRNGTDVRSVMDVSGVKPNGGQPVLFSYVKNNNLKLNSILSEQEKGRIAEFQYKDSATFIDLLNEGISDDDQAKARLEFPPSALIMHNKFIVFEKGSKKVLWTGTGNLSEECIGNEENSNIGIRIDNQEVADQYLIEFEEMYNYSKQYHNDRRFVGLTSRGIPAGKFHLNKQPNTKRYFEFADGNELRVHFSPTDDGEHRSIIPMILSAKKGDKIRISMFGSGGMELVRAIQWSAAKGVEINVILDRLTSGAAASWSNQSRLINYNTSDTLNLFSQNPYSNNPTPVKVRINKWSGMNHEKAATLTRGNQSSTNVEYFIVGSQNWSSSGNDGNDENMITIRNRKKSIQDGEEFNKHFDERLWPNSTDVVPIRK